MEGRGEGTIDGAPLGKGLGIVEGEIDGVSVVGTMLGAYDGVELGSCDGRMLGDADGGWDGERDG